MRKFGVFSVISACLALGLALASCNNGSDNGGETPPVVTFTVSFNANDGSGAVPSPIAVQAGSSVTLPNEGGRLSRSGYTFGGWNTNASGSGTNYSAGSSYTPVSDITLYARWNANYTVTFNINGGSGTLPPPHTVHGGSSVTLPNEGDLSRSGYTFGGWNTNAYGTGSNYQGGGYYTPTGNVTLYVKWDDAATYIVSFDANGGNGTAPSQQIVQVDYDIPIPSGDGLTKSNARFGGWSDDVSGAGAIYQPGDYYIPTEDITFYAVWIDTYTVTFDANGGGGTVPGLQTVDVGFGIFIPSGGGLAKSNARFGGWSDDVSGAGAIYQWGDYYIPTEDIIFYAVWIDTYTVTFDLNGGGGTVPSPQTADVGSSIILPDPGNLSKNGYTFSGWNTNTSGTGTNYSASAFYTNTANIILFASWAETSTIWTVSFETNGGNPVGEAIVLKNTPVSRPIPDPNRTGYTFDNWYANPELTTPYNFSSIVIRDITLYVKWNPITYTVAYDKDALDADGYMANSSHIYDVDKNLNSNTFVRIGYTFAGWARTAGGAVEFTNGASVRNLSATTGETVTLFAQWNINRYTVTFNANSGTPAPAQQTIDYGAKAAEPSAMTRTGYTFGGWFKEAALANQWNFANDTVTANITLYAKWTPRYTVTFSANSGSGTVPTAQTVTSGSSITLPDGDGLSRSGYIFGGWNTNSSGTGTNYSVGEPFTPTANTTLYARWIRIYTVTFNANGGSGTVPTAQTVTSGSSITLPDGDGLSRSGYIFGGWNTNFSGTGTNYSAGEPFTPTANITLYAKWTLLYTVTFSANSGSGTVPTAQTVTSGSNITLPGGDGLSRSGYAFGGWNTNSSGSGTNYSAGEPFAPTANTTLYAKWSPNSAGIIFDVSQIVDKAPIIADITISRTNSGYPVTFPVSINASDYDSGSIKWEVAGVGAYAGQTVTGSGASFTLNAAEVKYNSLGGHVLILTVAKSGTQYQRAIPFTIVH